MEREIRDRSNIRDRTEAWHPMPIPISSSFTFPSYLTCPSFVSARLILPESNIQDFPLSLAEKKIALLNAGRKKAGGILAGHLYAFTDLQQRFQCRIGNGNRSGFGLNWLERPYYVGSPEPGTRLQLC
jgi:hypothetical protein